MSIRDRGFVGFLEDLEYWCVPNEPYDVVACDENLQPVSKSLLEILKEQQAQFQNDAARYAPPAPDTIPEIPVVEPPEQEPTPIPQRKRRKCYVCGAPDACARRADEPAYCEEHRTRK